MELEARNLTKDYSDGVRALEDVSFHATPGEAIAVVGPSGSGKSTLLGILSSLEIPTCGSVLIDGKLLPSLGAMDRFRAERVGFVFQFHHLLPHLTLRENVEIPMIPLGVPARLRRSRANEILARLGLENRAEHLPARASGGERQRCAVARALANKPDLLLADEPTGNLDSGSGEQVMDFLLESARTYSAILIVATHDLEMARRADRQIRLRDGKILHSGEVSLVD